MLKVRLEEQSPRHDLVTNSIIVQPHSGGWLMAEGTEKLLELHPMCIVKGVSLSFPEKGATVFARPGCISVWLAQKHSITYDS